MLRVLFSVLIAYSVFIVIKSVQAKSKTLKFLLISDWGKGGINGNYWNSANGEERETKKDNVIQDTDSQESTNQASVASAMDKYSSTTDPSPEFIVALGDNFYTKGVSSTTDTR